jgi:2-C-methyl-D-erythritol 4-phosphate cytidylyltransferase/2-C-methyl-D-erythritol 2,4-cyclodiphosphate synthase
MKKISLIILSAGQSSRFLKSNQNSLVKKQWLRIDHDPLWLYVANRLKKFYKFEKIVITANEDELEYKKGFSNDFEFVVGGDTRQSSLLNALANIDSDFVMVTDVARCCVPKKLIKELIKKSSKYDCVVPCLDVSDTVVYKKDTINRDDVKLIQTPQLSKTKLLKKAIIQTTTFTDDSSAMKNLGYKIGYVKGSPKANKVTYHEDLKKIKCLTKPSKDFFVGSGFDVHAFEENKEMFLGGLKLNVDYGFKAHSDGDVLIHSLIDAMLGAIGNSDIGELFPDNDDRYKGISSVILLQDVNDFIQKVGFELVNIDITVMAQKPRLKEYKRDIKFNIAKILNIKPQFVNIKATTTEKLGFVGRSEGVAVSSTVLVKYFDWSST